MADKYEASDIVHKFIHYLMRRKSPGVWGTAGGVSNHQNSSSSEQPRDAHRFGKDILSNSDGPREKQNDDKIMSVNDSILNSSDSARTSNEDENTPVAGKKKSKNVNKDGQTYWVRTIY